MATVGWFSRRRKAARLAQEEAAVPEDLRRHLSEFIRTRRGVEAWLEQPTSFNKPSMLLIASDGESTRRSVPSVEYGYEFAADHDIPAYDAGVVPYPQRMRDYGERRSRTKRRRYY